MAKPFRNSVMTMPYDEHAFSPLKVYNDPSNLTLADMIYRDIPVSGWWLNHTSEKYLSIVRECPEFPKEAMYSMSHTSGLNVRYTVYRIRM